VICVPTFVASAPAARPAQDGQRTSAAGAPSPERHREIHEATTSLRKATEHREHAAHDFRGHRLEALKTTEEAIRPLELCLKNDGDCVRLSCLNLECLARFARRSRVASSNIQQEVLGGEISNQRVVVNQLRRLTPAAAEPPRAQTGLSMRHREAPRLLLLVRLVADGEVSAIGMMEDERADAGFGVHHHSFG